MNGNIPLQSGDKAPEFCLPDQAENTRCLTDFLGQWIVLYFYPKDNTPGCTQEAVDFSKIKEELENYNTVIIGVSADSPECHRKFISEKDLSIMLLSDENHEIQEKYGVWSTGESLDTGLEEKGLVRSTFLIDPEGKISFVWTNVKADGHAREVILKIERIARGKKI